MMRHGRIDQVDHILRRTFELVKERQLRKYWKAEGYPEKQKDIVSDPNEIMRL